MSFLHDIKRTIKEARKNRIFLISSSTSFYATISLLPFLLLLTNIIGFFIDSSFFIEFISSYLNNTQLIEFLRINLTSLSVFNLLVFVFAGTMLFSNVRNNINRVWGTEKRGSLIERLFQGIRKRALSFLVIVFTAFLIVLSLVVLVVSSYFNLGRYSIFSINLFVIIDLIIIFVFAFMLFLSVFRFLPEKKIKWKKLVPGTFLTTILFFIGQISIGIYFNLSEIQSAYSAVSSFLVILINFYYSSVIFYFGAIYTHITSAKQKSL
jgi:membrane protein